MGDYKIVDRDEEEGGEVEMKRHAGPKRKQEGKSPSVEQRDEWETGITSCFGKNDDFYSSDVEVCVMGCCAPCVLHGSNAERLGSDPHSFATHCFPYAGLFLIGNCFFGWNCLAPWFSYPNRTAIRRKFDIQGGCEAMARSLGCGRVDEDQLEHCETACDMATHILCHPCSLCQETRELRRRLPHPGFSAKPVIVMLPPAAQAMEL